MPCPPDLSQGKEHHYGLGLSVRDPRKETVLGWTREVSSSKTTMALKTLMSSSLLDIFYWRSYIHLKLNMFR